MPSWALRKARSWLSATSCSEVPPTVTAPPSHASTPAGSDDVQAKNPPVMARKTMRVGKKCRPVRLMNSKTSAGYFLRKATYRQSSWESPVQPWAQFQVSRAPQ